MQPQQTKSFYRGMALELQQHARSVAMRLQDVQREYAELQAARLQDVQREYAELQAAVALLIWSAPEHRLSMPASMDPIPDGAVLRRQREDDGLEKWWVEQPDASASAAATQEPTAAPGATE